MPSWNRIEGIQDKAAKTVKSYESANEKVQKLQRKGGSKLQMAQNDLQNHTTSLAGSLPALISAHQSMTLERLTELKEMGVRFETMMAENGNHRVDASEKGMNRLLGWEVEDEVRTMAINKLGGRPAVAGSNAPSREMGGFAEPPLVASGGRQGSQGPGGMLERPSSSSNAPSVNSMPRQQSMSDQPQSFSSTLKSKFSRKSTLLGAVGIGRSGSKSGDDRASMRGRRDSNATVTTTATGNQQSSGFDTYRAPPASGNYHNNGYGGGAMVESPTVAEPVSAGAPNVDSEGFSVPPDNRNQAPWERQSGARDLLDDDEEQGDNVSPLPGSGQNQPPRLNSMSIASSPIEETEEERQAALAKMQSTLLSKPPAVPARKPTVRGRRDVRNTTFNTLGDDAPLAQALKAQGQREDVAANAFEAGGSVNGRGGPSDPAVQEVLLSPTASGYPTGGVSPPVSATPSGFSGIAPVLPPLATQFTGDQRPGVSVQSPGSMSGSMNPFDQGTTTTAVTGSGLRATMTETVNAIFKSGVAQRVLVTGEVCVTMRDLAQYTSVHGDGPVHIRLDEFEQLEKVAPNPKYLSQVPDRPGEYYLNVQVVADATVSQPTRPVLFKYQLHVGEGRQDEYTPVEVVPQWKPAVGETRLLINYKAKDGSQLARMAQEASDASGPFASAAGNNSLTHISVTAGLGGPEVSGVQAKPPGGTWSAESRKMVWNVGDLSFGGPSSSGKVVAKFLTAADGPAGTPEGVMVRWKCEGSLTSGLGLSVVHEAMSGQGWRFEEVGKAVVSGKYIAE